MTEDVIRRWWNGQTVARRRHLLHMDTAGSLNFSTLDACEMSRVLLIYARLQQPRRLCQQ